MAIHYRIFVGESSWTEGSGGTQSMGSQRVRHNRAQYPLEKKSSDVWVVALFLFFLS